MNKQERREFFNSLSKIANESTAEVKDNLNDAFHEQIKMLKILESGLNRRKGKAK